MRPVPLWLSPCARTNIAAVPPPIWLCPDETPKRPERMTRQRLLLIVLLTWALAMIVPDVLRVQPLGSFGFYADNDGMIYEVVAPFDEEHQSPAWHAGIREGDKLALSKLRCFPYDPTTCGKR